MACEQAYPHLFMTCDCTFKFTIISPPHFHSFVCCWAGKPLSIRTELDTRNCFGMTNQGEFETVVRPHRLQKTAHSINMWCSLNRTLACTNTFEEPCPPLEELLVFSTGDDLSSLTVAPLPAAVAIPLNVLRFEREPPKWVMVVTTAATY